GGVVVQGGVDLEPCDPAVWPAPAGAEAIPAGGGAASGVGVRAVDDLRAILDKGFEVLAVGAVGADGDAHLDALDLEDVVFAARLGEALLLRQPDLVVL